MNQMAWHVRTAVLPVLAGLLLVAGAYPVHADGGCGDQSCSTPPPCNSCGGSGNATTPPPSGNSTASGNSTSGGNATKGSGGDPSPAPTPGPGPMPVRQECFPVDGTGGHLRIQVYPVLNMIVINECVFDLIPVSGPVWLTVPLGSTSMRVRLA